MLGWLIFLLRIKAPGIGCAKYTENPDAAGHQDRIPSGRVFLSIREA